MEAAGFKPGAPLFKSSPLQEISLFFLQIRAICPSDAGQGKARCATRHSPTPDTLLEQVCTGSILLGQVAY